VQQRFHVDIEADQARIFALLSDLGTYHRWLDIVHRVEPADAVPGDPGPAWWVTLRARLGPLARSKRLRMVRTVHDEPTRARFERREVDDRRHSAWVLSSTVTAIDRGSTVTMELTYDGGLWSPVLEGVLGNQVTGASENLRSLATASER
jgi:Polyketide cyclase / dehydrase and lipid transport